MVSKTRKTRENGVPMPSEEMVPLGRAMAALPAVLGPWGEGLVRVPKGIAMKR